MRRTKDLLLQSIIVLVVIMTVWFAYQNVLMHFGNLGVAFDLSFLTKESSLPLTESWLKTTVDSTNAWLYLVSLLNTLTLATFAVIFTTLLGTVLAFLSYHSNPLIVSSVSAYVEIFRNIPLLMQIIFWFNTFIRIVPPIRQSIELGPIVINNRGVYLPYYDVPALALFPLVLCWLALWLYYYFNPKWRLSFVLKWGFALWCVGLLVYLLGFQSLHIPKVTRFSVRNAFQIYPEFLSCGIGLVCYTSAYVAESIRGCLNAVPKGQFEVSRALGFSEFYMYRKIILPQAMPAIVPQMASHYMNITKNTSLGIGIGFPDLFGIFAGTILNQTGRAIEIIGIVMLTYLFLSLVIAELMQLINRRYEIWTGVSQK